MMREQIKEHPQLKSSFEAAMAQMAEGIKSVETHYGIVVNPSINPTDFDFQPPPAAKN
jgi:hypothetical protein